MPTARSAPTVTVGEPKPVAALAPPILEAGHRDHLDGLRAVAVYLVVLFHAGSGHFSGGFIGVDVFFVLSGYLVTQVLVRDLADHGSIRFGRFYARRMRRLLPAALFALLVSAAVYAALATPAEVISAANAFKAAFLYVTNWFFIGRSTGYFAADSNTNPVLHFWSLAVEEQFYLAWPLLLGVLVWITGRFRRRRWIALRIVIAGAALASASAAFLLRVTQPDRAYFGTDTRAYQLLAGALLALTPAISRRMARSLSTAHVLAGGAVIATVVLATNTIATGPITRGFAITVVTVVLIAALEADVGGPTRRLLSTSTATYLGRVSYGTYLWHWPVIIAIGLLTDVAPLPLAAVAALVGTGLASLSHHLIELPVRHARSLDRTGWPVVAAGLTMSVVAGLLVIPEITNRNHPSSAVASLDVQGFTPVPSNFNQDAVYLAAFGETVDCVDRAPQECTVVHGKGRHILLMGDSNAEMWIPAFTKMARDEGLTLSLAVRAGCLWQESVYTLSPPIMAKCKRTKVDAYRRVIPELKPDVIVLVNAREPFGPPNPTYTENPFNRMLRESTPASITKLGRFTKDIVIIEPAPTPSAGFNPLNCLAEAKVVESCRFVASTAPPTWLEQQERDIARRSPHVRTADFDRLICPFLPICDPIVRGTVVFWSGSHITAAYSKSLAEDVADYLKAQGLISP